MKTDTSFSNPRAILIRTPNWLGDLMMSTGFVRAVMERFPQTEVDLIVRRGFEGLPLPRRGRVIPYDKKTAAPGRFGAGFRNGGYSHFFLLPPSFSSAWMAFASRAPYRVGLTGPWWKGDGLRRFLLRPALRPLHPPRSVHLTGEYFDLLTPWGGGSPLDFPPGLHTPPDWLAAHLPGQAKNLKGIVVLAPGAEYGPAKQWPLAHYQAAAKALAKGGRTVVVAGLAREWDGGQTILRDAPGGVNLCGKTDLNGLVALLAASGLLISNDSGAMHVGAALGIPQVALFGSTNPVWTAPLNPKARVITHRLPCSPCYSRVCPLGTTACLTSILPEEPLQAAKDLLESPAP